MIVLGGGNTAMDCCRSSRRLGGEDVKVIVRSGFEEMKASPWEKEDAMHEGIPILNYLVPKEFTHENGKLTGMMFEKVKANYDAKGRRNLVPTGEPDQHFECDDVLVAIGQENAFPWIERDIGIEFDKWDMPVVDPKTMQSTHPEGVLRRRRGVRSEEHHLGGGARPRRRDLDRQVLQRRGHQRPAAADGRTRLPEDGHPRVELRQRHLARQALQGAAARQEGDAARHQGRGRARLRRELGLKEAQRCLNCDVQTVFTPKLCIECDACVDICPMDCITFTENGEEADLRTRLTAPAHEPDPGPLRLRRR